MRHFSLLVPVSLAALSLVGCGQMVGTSTPSSHGGIAVVDLDKVAQETRRDVQLANSLELAQNSLNQLLSKTVENAKEQLDTKKKGYGEELSAEDQKEYSAMERSAVTQLSQLQNKARAEFEQFKQKQIANFRAEIKPIAQEIANKRGMSVVIPKNEGLLLSVDTGADITEEVIKVLRERRPQVPEAKVDADQPAAKRPTKPVTQAAEKSDSADETVR